jgi:hypothetical protein
MLSEVNATPCAQREKGMLEIVSEARSFASDGFLRLL